MKKYKVHIDSLHINPSQKCNLKCNVCQCGDATNDELAQDTADRIFKDIHSVRNLGFIGGEVSLVPEAVGRVINSLEKYGTEYAVFGGYLNGTVYDEDCMQKLSHIAFNRIKNWSVSLDEWHLDSALEIIRKEQYGDTLRRLLSHPIVNNHVAANAVIFNEGRAKTAEHTYGLKKADPDPKIYEPYCYIKDDKIFASQVLMNCFGDAVTVGEYACEKESAYGNVMCDDGIANILLNSDKVHRYKSKAKYLDDYTKMMDANEKRLKKLCLPEDAQKQRLEALNYMYGYLLELHLK